jgi:hypothetical protein
MKPVVHHNGAWPRRHNSCARGLGRTGSGCSRRAAGYSGITPEDWGPLIAAGADFLAVSGAVGNDDEVAAIKAFGEVIAAA